MSIDAAVASKLVEKLGHDRVYPDARWLTTTSDGSPARLDDPVVMYRQTGGSGSKNLTGERGGLRNDFFTIEVFADDRDVCSQVRDKLLKAFAGPLDADYPGRWQTWGGPKSPVKVHWAEIDDPEADAEFVEQDMHQMFRWVRLVLEVQWLKE